MIYFTIILREQSVIIMGHIKANGRRAAGKKELKVDVVAWSYDVPPETIERVLPPESTLKKLWPRHFGQFDLCTENRCQRALDKLASDFWNLARVNKQL